jgi:hypothetical protein
MQQFIKNLDKKYQLTQTEKKEIPDFQFSPRSRNIKQNLENLFRHLNQIPEITSKEMYAEALKLFNVEIRKSGRGHVVVVTDDIGNPIRYPIRLSNFKEGPGFYKVLETEKESRINKQVLDKFQIAQWVRDLNRLVDSCNSPNSNSNGKIKRKRKGKNYRY